VVMQANILAIIRPEYNWQHGRGKGDVGGGARLRGLKCDHIAALLLFASCCPDVGPPIC